MPRDTLTIRERIMVEVVRRLTTMEAGAPADDPYLVGFGRVTRGASLEELHEMAPSGCSVTDTDERKTPNIQCMHCRLTVVVEFVAWVDPGAEDPDTVGNRYLGAVQRRMREDIYLTEPDDGERTALQRRLCYNVVELRNQLFVDSVYDQKVTGASFWEIEYRHAISDPRAKVKPGF